MNHFKTNDTPPDWCELRAFSVHALTVDEALDQNRQASKERLLVSAGRCQVIAGSHSQVLRAGQFFDPPEDQGQWRVIGATTDAEFVRLSGVWGAEIAGCGIWTMERDEHASDAGDPVDYPKYTRMDSHYHDYDEYWILLEGSATVVVGGWSQVVKTGDCVIIPAGCHHDMPDVQDTMRGVFFETTLIGQKRLGHLWTHTHGPATPSRTVPL
ncbi:MAG: cupin domain-containing protein [Marinosulfonomonas sp.]